MHTYYIHVDIWHVHNLHAYTTQIHTYILYEYTNFYVTVQAEFKARIIAAKRCGVCVCIHTGVCTQVCVRAIGKKREFTVYWIRSDF